MNHHGTLILALAATGLINTQIVLADTSADRCADTPYIGVCPQGCDEAGQPVAAGMAAIPAWEAPITAQVDCSSRPYLSPLCERDD